MRTRRMLAASILILLVASVPGALSAAEGPGCAPAAATATASPAPNAAPAQPLSVLSPLPTWEPAQISSPQTARGIEGALPAFSCNLCTPLSHCMVLHSCVLMHCC